MIKGNVTNSIILFLFFIMDIVVE